MATVLVVGSVNVDRVWRLAAPLRSGARLTFTDVSTRLGGGGFTTGAALLALGHAVRLVATLADDGGGRVCHAALVRRGFDTRHVRFAEGRTAPLEILVEPSGERTIIAAAVAERRRLEVLPTDAVDLVYVNARRVAAEATAALLPRVPVVAQCPLEPGERRPAHVLLAATSDLVLPADAFAYARGIAGPALEAFVLTDGEQPVRLFDAFGETVVPVPPQPPPADTTGAGDVFAAGYVDGLLDGAAPPEAVRRGNAVAARFLADRAAIAEPATVAAG